MKSRILDFLKRIALKQLQPFEFEDIIKPLALDEGEASRLAFGLMNDVIRQYHYFQVQTIDSFVNILLVGCSFKIGLSSRFKIQRNSREYLQLSLDELLDQANSDKKTYKFFEDFVRQYLFLENRSGWFPKEDLLKIMIELFRQYNTYQKPLHVFLFQEDFYSRKKRIYHLMEELRDICPPETNKRFRDHLEHLLDENNGTFDVDDLKAYWTKEDFPLNKGGEMTLQLENLWGQLHRELYGLCRDEAFCMFNPYVALFEGVISLFGRLAKRDDVLFLEELNRKASLLFDDGFLSVEELYFRMAARFEHYLMDEFQDTSLSQWRNLALMVEEALSHGGSLFYVGDKKQAIYAFRGGESRLFDALQVKLAGFNFQLEALDKNYRSCLQIINFNNKVFSLDNLQAFLGRRQDDAVENKRQDIHFSHQDFEAIANTFAHSHQFSGKDLPGGVVRAAYLEGRTKQERSLQAREKLMGLIKDISKRFALRDIAVLTRGNQEVEEITQWFLEEGIHASSERSSDIKNNPLIDELMNLLKVIHMPADNNAFAQFCLGELMTKATGIGSQQLRDFLFNCARQENTKEIYFYKEFQMAFPEVWANFFEDFFQHVGVYPLYELTAGIIKRLGCEKHFLHYQGFFMHLLELIKKQEEQSCDLSSFLDYYENLEGEDRFVPMAQIEALKVLTVHKAKGLEFPVVIIPYLEMDIKVGSGGRDGSQAYILDVRDEGMNLIRIKEKYREFCPELQARYEQEYRRAFLIELNSVYVALTRAIEELYVFIPHRVGNAVNPAVFLVPDDCLSIGTPNNRPFSHEPKDIHQRIKPFISGPWSGLQEEFLNEPAKSARLARLGEFYHAVLMHLGHINQANLMASIQVAYDKACQKFAPPSPEGQDGGFSILDIQFFINRPEVRPFFYLPDEAMVYCEKEFVNSYGDTKRIDRLIVLKDKVWIVDYKLSPGTDGSHQEQMDGYIELIRQFYPKHEISGDILYLMGC